MSSSRRRSTAVIAATTLIVAGLGAAVAGPGQAVTSGAAPAAKVAKAKPDKALTDNAVFFASDGLRQDLVKKYADQGRDADDAARSCATGCRRADDGLLTQAPPNTGAGWYTLATGAWPGVHGSTNNTFHKNGDAVRQPHRRLRPGRAAGRVDRPGRRARRAQGRPGRVGRRTQRVDPGADHRLPDLPLRPRRRHQLHRRARRRALRRRRLHRGVRPAVRPPRRVRRPGAVPAGRARHRRPAGPTCRRRTARRRRCGCGCSTPASTSTASTPTSTTAPTTAPPTTTECCSRPPRTAPTPSATSPRASGPTSR